MSTELIAVQFSYAEFASLRACAKSVFQIGVSKVGNDRDAWPEPLCDLADAISIMDQTLEDFHATEGVEQ
jgi:hypothetical protein